MAGTLTALDAILKTQYLGPIRDQLNSATLLLDRIQKNYDSVVGKNFTIPLHYGRNEGIGARADGGTLPTAGNQSYKECIVPMRYQYGRIEITGPTIKAASSNQGAFVRAVDSEMRGLSTDMKSSINRQAFGDGSGALTACASAASDSKTVTVASTAKLRVGMPVDILVTSTGATTAGVVGDKVASITSGTVFVLTTGVTTYGSIDNTYSVYVSGSRNNEMMGLSGIAAITDPASGALQNLAVATYPWWKATVQGNSGTNRAISDTILQTALDALEQNSNGKASALYTSFGVRRAYQALLTATKQLVNTQELKGGYKAITFNDLPIIADKDAPANTMFCIDENELNLFRLSDFDWMDEDGAILSRVTGKDAYEAVLFVYQELGTMMRNASVRIDDITEA
jgi:hypothetical protein